MLNLDFSLRNQWSLLTFLSVTLIEVYAVCNTPFFKKIFFPLVNLQISYVEKQSGSESHWGQLVEIFVKISVLTTSE